MGSAGPVNMGTGQQIGDVVETCPNNILGWLVYFGKQARLIVEAAVRAGRTVACRT